jgi:hypothetical protein
MKITNFVFNDLKTKKEKHDFIEFLRFQTNTEFGGYRMFDGTRQHLMHIPEELSDLMSFLKTYEKNIRKKFSNFLEVGYSSGKTNTIFNKFFNFEHIVAIDDFTAEMSSTDLLANLKRKNLTLVCGSSYKSDNQKIIKKFAPYDLIFIDANHEYEFVKKDFENFSPFLEKGGVIAFHDVDCPDWRGINQFWNELEATGKYSMQTFVERGYRLQYGIGMLTIK